MWYSEIADLYDQLVRFEEDIPFFAGQCRRHGGPVLDLMAGTGRVSIPLIKEGLDLTCVDASPEMLRLFRKKLIDERLQADVREGDVRKLDFEQGYATAIIPFCSFSELVEEEDRLSVLQGVFRALLPGGVFICTLHNPVWRINEIKRQPRLESSFPHDASGGVVRFRFEQAYDRTSGVVDGVERFEIFSEDGAFLEDRLVRIRFRLVEKNWFETAATDTGFEIVSLFGDYDMSEFKKKASPLMIWVLSRPA